MSSNIAQNTTNSAKSLAQQVARQMAREPLEIFKDVKEQVTGNPESSQDPAKPQENRNDDQEKLTHQQEKLNDQMKSSRLIDALKREIDDIRKQDVYKDLQARISGGEEVPLEEYTELSPEQKQVLAAQMEAVKIQKANNNQGVDEVPTVHSKPSRRFGAGQKSQAEKEQTHVEKPVQNSI